MTTSELVPSLMFMTIAAALLIGIAAFAWFLRKRRNRTIAAHAFSDDERTPDEAARGVGRARVSDAPARETERL